MGSLNVGYGIDVWLCDPHSLWQRGQIENLNRHGGWWFPSGNNLGNTDPTTAQHAADIINRQRRRTLDYHSPATLHAALAVRWSLDLAGSAQRGHSPLQA